MTENIRLSKKRALQRRFLNLDKLNTTQLEQWQRSIEVPGENGQRSSSVFSPNVTLTRPTLRPPAKLASGPSRSASRGNTAPAGSDAVSSKHTN